MQHEKRLNLLKKGKNKTKRSVTLCQHACHISFIQKCFAQFPMRQDGCFFSGCCYLNNQLQQGAFSPRKIGSTFEMNIKTHLHTNTHTRTLSLTDTHILGLWHFKRVILLGEIYPLQSLEIHSWLKSQFASPGGAKSEMTLDLSYRVVLLAQGRPISRQTANCFTN